jgi:hypothetical protein
MELLRDETANAMVDISNTFVDIETTSKDAVKRAKYGMRFLVVSVLLQIIISFLQIFS